MGGKVLALQYAKLQHIGQDHSNILTQQYQQWLKGRFLLTRFNPAHVFAGHWQPFFDHLEPYDELSMAALLKRYLPTAKVYAGKKPMDVVIESLVNCSPISYFYPQS